MRNKKLRITEIDMTNPRYIFVTREDYTRIYVRTSNATWNRLYAACMKHYAALLAQMWFRF